MLAGDPCVLRSEFSFYVLVCFRRPLAHLTPNTLERVSPNPLLVGDNFCISIKFWIQISTCLQSWQVFDFCHIFSTILKFAFSKNTYQKISRITDDYLSLCDRICELILRIDRWLICVCEYFVSTGRDLNLILWVLRLNSFSGIKCIDSIQLLHLRNFHWK